MGRSMGQAPHDEDVPFLDFEDRDRTNQGTPSPPPEAIPVKGAPTFRSASWQAKTPGQIILVVAIIKFLVVLSGMMMMMPLYRLMEDALCHVYYKDDSQDMIDEMKCKVDEVQTRLSSLLGWLGLVSAIISFLVAYPYGLLSDRVGRKPVLMLSYGGLAVGFCSTPWGLSYLSYMIRENPYLLMLGSLLVIVGGGMPVFMSTMYAIATDVSSEEDKAANFLYLVIGASMGTLIGPLISGIIMYTYNAWLPVYCAVSIFPFIGVLLFLIPETLSIDAKRSEGSPMTWQDRINHGLSDLRSTMQILRNKNVLLIAVVYLFESPRSTGEMTTLPQYISKHFGWTLAETTFLLSPLGLLYIVVLALLPKMGDLLTSPRYGFSTFRKDLFLTRASILILTVAFFLTAISHNVVFFIFTLVLGTIGGAQSPLARATISHYVDTSQTARLYALIGMVEVIGSFTGGPVIAFFFNKGIELKGMWTGLPWLYLSFLCFITFFALIFVKPPIKMKDGDEEMIGDDQVPPGNRIRLD